MPLNNIHDLVQQFNFIGYQEVCIYPTSPDLSYVKADDQATTKGIAYVYPGYAQRNSTGKGYMN
mgnify:CR=1 FL=1